MSYSSPQLPQTVMDSTTSDLSASTLSLAVEDWGKMRKSWHGVISMLIVRLDELQPPNAMASVTVCKKHHVMDVFL